MYKDNINSFVTAPYDRQIDKEKQPSALIKINITNVDRDHQREIIPDLITIVDLPENIIVDTLKY